MASRTLGVVLCLALTLASSVAFAATNSNRVAVIIAFASMANAAHPAG